MSNDIIDMRTYEYNECSLSLSLLSSMLSSLTLDYILVGNVNNFQDPFEGSITEVKGISLSIYSALFSYAGW